MTTRLEDWPARLAAFIEQRRRTPFAWGVHDCCQFSRRGVEAMTGSDPAAAWKLRAYRTERGAAALLARLGGLAALPARAGLAGIPLTLAGRGDVVLAANAGRPALGLCLGPIVALAGERGLLFVPTLACERAWRVG